jgi:hypothetical protein
METRLRKNARRPEVVTVKVPGEAEGEKVGFQVDEAGVLGSTWCLYL